MKQFQSKEFSFTLLKTNDDDDYEDRANFSAFHQVGQKSIHLFLPSTNTKFNFTFLTIFRRLKKADSAWQMAQNILFRTRNEINSLSNKLGINESKI